MVCSITAEKQISGYRFANVETQDESEAAAWLTVAWPAGLSWPFPQRGKKGGRGKTREEGGISAQQFVLQVPYSALKTMVSAYVTI